MPAEISVVPIMPQVDAEVVERLELLLAEAKAGKLDYLAYALTRPNGNFLTSWAGTGRSSCLEISGLIGQLWWEYQNSINEKPTAPDAE